MLAQVPNFLGKRPLIKFAPQTGTVEAVALSFNYTLGIFSSVTCTDYPYNACLNMNMAKIIDDIISHAI